MERCPCCNARLTGTIFCPRCQADLGGVLGGEKWAQHWLNTALRLWLAREPRMAILALTRSIALKQTPLALAFRDFIIRRQCAEVLALWAKKHYPEAEIMLGLLRDLNPGNELIGQLQGFTGHLRVSDGMEMSTGYSCHRFTEL
jgi:hypothetical protein